jgi:hypothetical protein
MLSKKLIIEKYIGDLKNHVPQSPARDQRLEMLENELEAIKNLGDIGDVSETLTVKEVLEILDDSDHLDDARMLISEASSR